MRSRSILEDEAVSRLRKAGDYFVGLRPSSQRPILLRYPQIQGERHVVKVFTIGLRYPGVLLAWSAIEGDGASDAADSIGCSVLDEVMKVCLECRIKLRLQLR
jgi:hypothetical protein